MVVVRSLSIIALGLVACISGQDDGVCNVETGGSCRFFNCKKGRNAMCVDQACRCPPGKCTNSEGTCELQHLEAECDDSVFEYYHMNQDKCTFTKDSGSGMPAAEAGAFFYPKADVADAATVTKLDNVVGISWYAGERGVVNIGLTTDSTDDRDFDHGVYLKQDDVGRFAGPSSGHYQADDIFNMTIACGAAKVDFYKNDVKFTSQEAPTDTFPQSVYAKIWITDFAKSLRIKEVAVLQNCEWGLWSDWSACSVTCGDGTQTRARAERLPAKNCGTPCVGETLFAQACSAGVEGHCPIDCTWGDWSEWSDCSAKSGGGQKKRTREKTTTEAYGGVCVGEASDANGCGMVSPPCSDCEWGLWASWSECSKACGAGEMSRSRDVAKHSTYGGQTCHASSKELAECTVDKCAETDCAFADWSDWSSCTATCGSGSRTQTRTTIPSDGAPCDGPIERTGSCNVAPCDLVGTWSVAEGAVLIGKSLVFTKPAGDETVFTLAGSSMAANVRSIAVMNLGSGSIRFGLTSHDDDDESFAHGAFKELTDESKYPTTISIESDFVVYENGEKTGDLGAATARRMYAKIFIKDTTAAAQVVFEKAKTVSVAMAAGTQAAATGKVAAAEFSSSPAAIFEAQRPAPQFLQDTRADRRLTFGSVCNLDTGGSCGWFACKAARHSVCVNGECECPPGKCTDSSGTCTVQKQTATCSHKLEWEYYHMAETADVNAGHGQCTFQKNSGSGMPAAPDGTDYYAKAAVSDAAAWSLSPSVVGISWYAGERGVVSIGLTTDPNDDRDFSNGVYLKQDAVGRFAGPRTGHYKADDIFNMTIACGAHTVDFYKNDVQIASQDAPTEINGVPQDFPQTNYAKIWITDINKAIRILDIAVLQDCQWGDWSPWSECPVTCGSGMQTRGRVEAVPAKNCGKVCEGPKEQTQTCSKGIEGHCPVDCIWGDWTEYSKCDDDTKEMSRTRVKTTEEGYGGACQGIGSQTVSCGLTPPAPVDCAWNDWQEWDACTTTCGVGGKSRSRTVGTHSRYGGMPCHDISKQVAPCGNDPCPPIDCSFGDWSAWGSCSVSCGNGLKQKTRDVAVHASNGGSTCTGKTEVEKECNVAQCHMLDDWKAADNVYLDGGDLIVIKYKSADGTTWAPALTSISGQVESIGVHVSGVGSIRFGLTKKADDDETFAHGFYQELQAGGSKPAPESCPPWCEGTNCQRECSVCAYCTAGPMAEQCSTTIAIESGTVVVYSDDKKTNDDIGTAGVKHHGMFAKIFLLESTVKAEVIYVKVKGENAVAPALTEVLSALVASDEGPSWFAMCALAVGASVVAVLVSRALYRRGAFGASVREPLLA